MSVLTRHKKTIKLNHYGAMLVTALLVFMVVPAIDTISSLQKSVYSVYINNLKVGDISERDQLDHMIIEARRRLAKETDGLMTLEYLVTVEEDDAFIGDYDTEETVIDNIYTVMSEAAGDMKKPVYEVKINEFTVNLATADEVLTLLQEAKSKYDESNDYTVQMVLDPTRELNVLTTQVYKTEELESMNGTEVIFPTGGGIARMDQFYEEARKQALQGFDFGIKELDFAENVEVVPVFVDAELVSSLDEAIEMVTKKEEKDTIYEVEPGDSLSVIAEKNGTTLENLIAMNKETIPNANATIRVGDMVRVTCPQPELSVKRTEEIYYEENYDADVIYIDNDNWYTNHSEVKQDPVAGFRKVVADIFYRNDVEEGRSVVYENIVAEAIPKIIERGTQDPPTFLKPISGGRLSSRFGRRKAPTKGASTFHKGVDWATPVGTSVVASSGGKVIRAGWGAGYGYCVYIVHPDGKVTRYGHLSKVLVKVDQTVKQGEKIALSGNTGVSSGPHVHFEILVNGAQVDPFTYL